jgi:phosphatidylglycerophosphate synthase
MNKPVDSWWTVMAIDPLAVRLVPWLSRRAAVTPTRLTGAGLALGLGAAALFAAGEHIAGAILFEIRFLLDCLDGKLARYSGATSEAGAFVDVAGDMLVVGLCYAALSASVLDTAPWVPYPLLAGVVLVTAASWLQTFRRLSFGETTRTRPGAEPAAAPGWLARRRLKPYPSAIEAETASLFLAPLLLADRGIVVVLLAAYAFYALSIADNVLRIHRRISRR